MEVGLTDSVEDSYFDSLGSIDTEEDRKLISGSLLDKIKNGNFTVDEILEEDDLVLLLQYLRYKYPSIVAFFKELSTLETLINYVVLDNTKGGTDSRAVKLTMTAATILSSQIPDIDEIVFKNEDLVLRFYDYWEDQKIDHLRANLVVKIIIALNEAHPEDAVSLLNKNPQIIPAFMKHLEITATADFFAHLCRLEDLCQGVHQWLLDIKLIDRLFNQLDDTNSEHHPEVSEIVKSIVSALKWNSILMTKLFSKEIVENFLKTIFNHKKPSTFKYGCQVLISMLRLLSISDVEEKTTHDPYGDLEQLPFVVKALVTNLDKFVVQLKRPNTSKPYLHPNHQTIQAFGWHRYNILVLIDTLLNLKYTAVNKELDKSNIFTTIVDLMFQYEHNSFCHTIVEKIAIDVLDNIDPDFGESFIQKTNILNHILDAEKKLFTESGKISTKRKEYMPFLYKLALKINEIFGTLTYLREYIKGREAEWDKMISRLEEQNKRLKESEIIVDRNQPRGKVIVEDEEGFDVKVDDDTSGFNKDTISPANLDSINNELDLNDFGETDLDKLLAEGVEDEGEEDEKNVMSAIDAILDGNYDSIVMDKSKLMGLTLEDILKNDL